MQKHRPRLSYANVVATLALFLAVAGGTTAVALSGRNNVDADDIQKGAVAGREVKNESLFKRDLGKGAVGSGELGASSVTGGKIKDETVWSRELGAGAVTAADLHGDSVTGATVGDGSLRGVDVANGSLGGADIGSRSIGAPDLAAVPAVRVMGTTDSPKLSEVIDTLIFDTDTSTGTYDPLGMWDPSAPEHVTVPIDGIYVAAGKVRWANDDTETSGGPLDQGWRLLQISGPHNQDIRTVVGANRHPDERMQMSHTVILNLEAGDTVSMQVAQANEDDSVVSAIGYELAVTWVGPSPGPPN